MTKQYTPAERKQIHDSFVVCKKHLHIPGTGGRGTFEYICHALQFGPLGYQGSKLAREVIEDRLVCCLSYESWLSRAGFDLYIVKNGVRCIDMARLQLSRHAWVDSLIKEFSA